jgi:hypothetical protein
VVAGVLEAVEGFTETKVAKDVECREVKPLEI